MKDLEFSVGGLWHRTTPTGKDLYEGTFPIKERHPDYPDRLTIYEAIQALLDAGKDKAVLTVWVNTDKRHERGPDMNIQVKAPWEGPKNENKNEDETIPF